MDAVKFVEERRRMCNFYGGGCTGCPAYNVSDASDCLADIEVQGDAAEQVKIVEEWSATHPRKTRQSVFLDNYPTAKIDSQSVLYACPADIYGDNVCPKKKDNAPIICYDCRREFWMQEVE